MWGNSSQLACFMNELHDVHNFPAVTQLITSQMTIVILGMLTIVPMMCSRTLWWLRCHWHGNPLKHLQHLFIPLPRHLISTLLHRCVVSQPLSAYVITAINIVFTARTVKWDGAPAGANFGPLLSSELESMLPSFHVEYQRAQHRCLVTPWLDGERELVII